MSTEKRQIEQLYADNYQRMLTVARLMLKDDDEAHDAKVLGIRHGKSHGDGS